MNVVFCRYKHTEKGSGSDTFMFDVTNGIQSLHGLEFVIEVIPRLIPLEIRDFAVMEGDQKLLTGDSHIWKKFQETNNQGSAGF